MRPEETIVPSSPVSSQSAPTPPPAARPATEASPLVSAAPSNGEGTLVASNAAAASSQGISSSVPTAPLPTQPATNRTTGTTTHYTAPAPLHNSGGSGTATQHTPAHGEAPGTLG